MISLRRLHPTEPLLKPRDLAWQKNGILNPGVTIYNGRIVLLFRAVGADHVSRLGVATSGDGVRFDSSEDEAVFVPDPSSSYETHGVEDPRITFMGDAYAVVYVAAAVNKTSVRPTEIDWKTRVSLAFTRDFRSFERKGVILHSYNDKDAALFPVKWGDYWYMYHRRHPSIWLSKSKDLNTWEDVCDQTCMVVEPDTSRWDNDKIGIGSPPIATSSGWLVFYHGRDKQGFYRIGAFLADYDHPNIVCAKLPYPLLEPRLPFEVHGEIPNVVFTCGAVEISGIYYVYYGGADFAIGGATIAKKDLLAELNRYRV